MLCKNLPKTSWFWRIMGGGVHEDLSYMADYSPVLLIFSYSVSSAYAMYWIIRESVSSLLELRLVTAFCWIEFPSGEVKAYILP